METPEIKLNLPKFENKKLLYWLSLIPILFAALYIRTRNLGILQGKYLIELDSYFFFRYSRMLLEQGSVPPIDFMRYVPVGHQTESLLFFPKTMVFFYKLISPIFPNLTQIEWHIIYPPVITAISLIFFFLFVKELFGNKAAFFSTAFLSVIPAYMQRTGAGFADHEAFAMLWMFLSLWLFVLAWKSDNLKKYLPFAALSGIFAGMMAGTWGGYIFLSSGIALFIIAYTLLNPDLDKKHFMQFSAWAALYFATAFLVIGTLSDTVGDIRNLAIIFGILFLGSHIAMRKKLPQIYSKIKLPASFVTLLIVGPIVTTGAILSGLLNPKTLIFSLILKQEVGRHFLTVSENAQPYFLGGWWQSFGWIFLLALAGSAVMFFLLFKAEDKSRYKLDWLAGSAYVIFFSTFIFGRYSTNPKFPNIADFLSNTYPYWIVGFVIAMVAVYILAYYRSPENISKLKDKWPILLIGVWLLLTLLAARGQIRLLFATVPPIAIAAGFFVSSVIDWSRAVKPKWVKWSFVIAILAIALFSFSVAAEQSKVQNQYSGSMMPGQWESVMTWARTNTSEDAVFAHWWDYGHMTIAIGERAAVTDGGNAKGWNYQSGRYFLTGKDDNSTLAYLKTHKVTHVLISEEEIPKYHAFSFIGSDENLDRTSTIGVFAVQKQSEVRNGTAILYGGGWILDKDYIIGRTVLPRGQAFLAGFTIMQDPDGKISEPPVAHAFYNNQQIDFEVPCLVISETGNRVQYETNNTLNGCLVLVPNFLSQDQVSPSGGALWLSEKVYDTNMAKLYIYDEDSEYFKKVYDDNVPLGIYNNNVIGPIRVWEVSYPENIEADDFYLQSSPYG